MVEVVVGAAIAWLILWLALPKPPRINYDLPDLDELGKRLERTRKEELNGTRNR